MIQTSDKAILLYLQHTKPYAFCPSCSTKSKYLHSYYPRFLLDLSSGTQHINIHLKSRKWFCEESFCPKKFTVI
uniref:transposase family protein n=1 Tax=Solibacillus sp. FSL R5-0691 TaxID=2921653 RepID=UPI00403F4C6C